MSKTIFSNDELKGISADILGTIDYDTYKDDWEEEKLLGEIERLISQWVINITKE